MNILLQSNLNFLRIQEKFLALAAATNPTLEQKKPINFHKNADTEKIDYQKEKFFERNLHESEKFVRDIHHRNKKQNTP